MIFEYSLPDLLDMIEEKYRKEIYLMHNDNIDRFQSSPGSKVKHQSWKGGYVDHLTETMNLAIFLYKNMREERVLPFTLSDAILVLYLHDLEKPFKYVDPKINFTNKLVEENFVFEMCNKYTIELTNDHINALLYIHGENEDYDPEIRVQGPLAAFVHVCDTISARIWYDYPK